MHLVSPFRAITTVPAGVESGHFSPSITVCVDGLLLFIILPLGLLSVLTWHVFNALKIPKLIVARTGVLFLFA